MSNSQLPQDFFAEPSRSEVFSIDYKRILYGALRYWYLILLFVIMALLAAFLRNRYATKIYPVTASIIIKESQEGSGGELLYNNPLVSFYRNYLNELYLIRSYPLIQNTLEDLNFEVSFYRQGNFLTTEVYKIFPVKAQIIKASEKDNRSMYFRLVSTREFELGSIEESLSKRYNFGDTVDFEGLKVIYTLPAGKPIDEYKDERLIFSYRPSALLTASYVNRLKAEWAEEGAGVVNLSINGSNPLKEIDFLTGLIKQYQAYDLEKKNIVATRTIDFITDQLNGITDSLRKAELQLETFKDKNVVTDLTGEALRLYQKVEGLETQKAELNLRQNYYQYLQDYIQTNTNLDQIILPSSVGISDNILSDLISKMIDLQLEMKMLLSRDKLENPLINERRRRIEEIKQDVVESVKNQKGVDKIKLDFLNKGIREVEKQLNRLPVAERQLVSIRRNYTLLENLYTFLLQKRAEAGISKASTTTDIVVVNPPMARGDFIKPKPSQNYMIAGFLGLSIPLFVLVLIEIFNTRIQSREDIEKITKIPFIGGVGHKKSTNNLEVFNYPKSANAESFRALRSNLNYFINNKDKAVFLITSSISGEGKTFTSINLASVFALSGKKTLIVGADMRRPKLFDDFGLSNELGLSSYLAGLNNFQNVVQRTSLENLDLISAGPVPPNPSELLLSSRMDTFIEDAKKNYDHIIIDTPPLALVTDAFSLSKYADHTLFVVRQNYTPKVLLKNAEEFYASGKLKNISLELNDIVASGLGYGYGYGYTYGYGYGYYGKPRKGMNEYYES